MNGWGIGLNSLSKTSGDNVIERCAAWGNRCVFGTGDMGGLTGFSVRRDVIRDSVSFLNAGYGFNIYGTGTDGGKYGEWQVPGNDEANKSRLIGNLAWGNGTDVKIKTGVKYFHTVERGLWTGHWSVKTDPIHCLIGKVRHQKPPGDNVVLHGEEKLDPDEEFADPANHDYRLQGTSRFRGAGPDGSDRGPHPCEANVFFVKPDGDDGADGLSMKHAWRSLVRGVRDLGPDDTLYLAPGVYPVGLNATLTGDRDRPISIWGRGDGPVLISGVTRLTDCVNVEFRRLTFERPVTCGNRALAPSTGSSNEACQPSAVSFHNCRFRGGPAGLDARGVSGLNVRHCEFTDFRRAAISLKSCANVDLRGNWFDNTDGVAIRIDNPAAIAYAGYNGFRNLSKGWNKPNAPSGGVRRREVECDGGGPKRKTAGPFHTRLGVHKFKEKDTTVLRIVGPFVHSTGATSANIEWWATAPGRYELAWGTGEELTNVAKRYVHQAASFSLTGLEPNATYRLRIKPDRPMASLDGDETGDCMAITFTTKGTSGRPKVYYVAVNGDNDSSGLFPEEAWETAAHAADRARPGDTVLIGEGVYRESVWLRVTGEKGRPITFKAMPGHKVTFDGMDRALKYAFMGADKRHLRFDALYFSGFDLSCSRTPFILMPRNVGYSNGALILYRCHDVHVTRCFLDGRGPGYSPGLVLAMHCADLVVRNNAIVSTMGGGVNIFWESLGARVENNVFLRSLISHAGLHVWPFKIRKPEDKCFLERNIFSDNLAKKAFVPLLLTNRQGTRIRHNCFFLRKPPEDRVWGRDKVKTIADFLKVKDEDGAGLGNIAADPRFAGDPGLEATAGSKKGYSPDRMMRVDFPLDFDFLFATTPEAVERGIGLQPEAFADLHFNKPDAAGPRPSDVILITASRNLPLVRRMAQDGASWRTGAKQESGMWVEMTFARPMRLREMSMDFGNGFPKAFEVHADRGDDHEKGLLTTLAGRKGLNTIAFPHAPTVKRVKIVLTEPRDGWWSISRLTINGRTPVCF